MAPDRATPPARIPWGSVREQLRARGLRWTPQRRVLVDVLSGTTGHVTGTDLVERCRAVDPGTVSSTVYRTLAVLEELGLISHSHGHDGREEFHVLPEVDHGHLHCTRCGRTWEILSAEAAGLVESLQRRGFAVDLSHLSVGGLCAACLADSGAGQDAGGGAGQGGPSGAGPGRISSPRGEHPAH